MLLTLQVMIPWIYEIWTIAYSSISKKKIKAPHNWEMTDGFPSQRASDMENIYIWLRHNITEPLRLQIMIEKSVKISSIDIYETFHGGAVTCIKLKNPDGNWVSVFSASPADFTSSRIFKPNLKVRSVQYTVTPHSIHAYHITGNSTFGKHLVWINNKGITKAPHFWSLGWELSCMPITGWFPTKRICDVEILSMPYRLVPPSE